MKWVSKGRLSCDLLFMSIICLAVSLGNYFYLVHLIAEIAVGLLHLKNGKRHEKIDSKMFIR